MKCLYTNAHSMGNKLEELEAIVLLESYNQIAITETWWDESHDCNVATGCSEGTGEERGAGALPFTLRKHDKVKSCP